MLKLMDKGMPFDEILELEESEFQDWLSASQALDIDRKLIMMNAASSPHWKQSDRTAEFNKLKTERELLLGDNPFKVNEHAVNRTRELLKKQGKVRKVNGRNDKRNSRKIKA